MLQLDKNLAHYLKYAKFVETTESIVADNKENEFFLVSLDFDNFNYINDLFGYLIGDKVLHYFAKHLSKSLQEDEYFCHLHADQYALWMKKDKEIDIIDRIASLTMMHNHTCQLLPKHYNIVFSGGIVKIEPTKDSIATYLDKANFARKKAKGLYQNKFVYFDEELLEEVEWRKSITLMMDKALRNHEFAMYLQPKVMIETGEVAGAEALVRWNSGALGLILPNDFIPIMEQNGFIRELDFFMLDQACLYLKEVMARKEKLLPISVNFSKVHLQDKDFVDTVFNIVNRHGIHTNLIEIEFTENVFAENFQSLIDTTISLKYLGFKVALDDFGSAYSSLNCLKDLPLDVIKIDKKFFDVSKYSNRGRIIITKVIELIKSLQMTPIMEGIEELDQVNFLKQLGCDMGQGFFYAKPMPLVEYCDYIKNNKSIKTVMKTTDEKVSNRINGVVQEFQLDNWELYTLGKNIDIGLMKGYLDGEVTVQYVNDKALEYLGYTRQEIREVFQNTIVAFTHPDDVATVQKNAEQLIRTGKPLKFSIRAIRKDGKVIFLEGRSSCVIDAKGRPVGLYAFQEVSEEGKRILKYEESLQNKIKELEHAINTLNIREEKYRIIMNQSDDIMFEWNYENDHIDISDKFQKIFGRVPESENFSINEMVRKNIHPKDRLAFSKWIEETYQKPTKTEAEFRLEDKSGHYIWVRGRASAICDATGKAIHGIGVFTNIDASKREIETLIEKSQLDSLTNLYNKGETQERIQNWLNRHNGVPAAFFIVDLDNFKSVNDGYGHRIGDLALMETASLVRSLFSKNDIVGRIGGDEIVVFARRIDDIDKIKEKADEIVETIKHSSLESIDGHILSTSVGVAITPQFGDTYEGLYQLADIALYEAKSQGKGRSVIYHAGIKSSLNNEDHH